MTPRLTSVRLRLLADELTPRYTAPLLHFTRVRLLTSARLDRLAADGVHGGVSVPRVWRGAAPVPIRQSRKTALTVHVLSSTRPIAVRKES